LGQNRKGDKSSMFKDDYKKFEGQVESIGHYLVNYEFDELQDPLFQKKMEAAPNGIMPLTDSIGYSFTFDHDTCVSSQVNHTNVLDYQKLVLDLNAHYKKKPNSKNIWLDYSGQIEVDLKLFKYSQTNFYVNYHRIK